MMNNILKLPTRWIASFAAVVVALHCLVACSDELTSGSRGASVPILFEPTISQVNTTRATDAGFADGDCMGVYIVDYDGSQPGELTLNDNRANNLLLTYESATGRCVASSPVYWKDGETPIDVYGYYPYSSGVNSVTEYQFSVSADQSVCPEGAMSEYEKSDFLWAKSGAVTPVTGKVHLTFGHRLSGVKVTLTRGEGFSDMEWEKLPRVVSVDNTLRNATINLSTGVATPIGSFDHHVIMAPQGSDVYRAVVVPQTVEAEKPVIGITIDGTSYHLALSEPLTYQPSKLHTFTVKVDRRDTGDYSLAIVDRDITAWENDELSHAFEAIAYTVIDCPVEGTLKQCVEATGKDIADIRNLKVNGRMNDTDFEFIRNEMPYLQALNIYDVTVFGHEALVLWSIHEPTFYSILELRKKEENRLPNGALRNMKSLSHLVLPEKLISLGERALESIGLGTNSTLIIPNSVRILSAACMGRIKNGNIILPDSLEIVGDYAFTENTCWKEFKFSNTIKFFGEYIFYQSAHNSGVFMLSDSLVYIGRGAFEGSWDSFTGDEIRIPSSITSVPEYTFGAAFTNGVNLYMHDGVTEIGNGAFSGHVFNNKIIWPKSLLTISSKAFYFSKFRGGIGKFPDGLVSIGSGAFSYAEIGDNLQLPEGLATISERSFAGTNIKSVELPTYLTSIGLGAFVYCENLQSVKLGRFLDDIGDYAFGGCQALKTVQCLNPTPPNISSEEGTFPFALCDYDHLVLEVPEQSVGLYRNTPGWNRIKYITAYHELAVSVPQISCLDKGVKREAVVRSEGAWSVAECPSWCHVSPSSGTDRATEITITVDGSSASREGSIVFSLDGKSYTTTCDVRQLVADYPEDKEIVLQTATEGNTPVNIFIAGDGFTADEVADGTYLNTMKQQMEYFFAIEPFKTYRNYFTVSTALAASPQKGVTDVVYDSDTRFGTVNDPNKGLRCDYDLLKNYVVSVAGGITASNADKALVMLIVNQDGFSGNVPSLYDDIGFNLSITTLSSGSYPYDTRGLIQHYAGGKAFGLQAEEYISHLDFLKGCTCPGCSCMGEYNALKAKGGCQNISLSGAYSAVPWSHLIFDSRYSDIVDIYEGGYRHSRGVFRSEPQSCMGTYIQYYSTVSREAIVRRIMQLSGSAYSFESFVSKDSREGRPQQ